MHTPPHFPVFSAAHLRRRDELTSARRRDVYPTEGRRGSRRGRCRRLRLHGTDMTAQTYWWVSAWLLVTIPVIFWDAGYLFLRPRSMEGGDLHWIWQPYSIYQNIDYIYGVPAWTANDGFPNAQSLLNIIENFLNIAYLYLAHVAHWPPANLIAFTAASLTLSKTLLYWVQEYYAGFRNIGHNSVRDLVLYWIVPNGLWLVLPTLIVLRLGKDLIASLTLAHEKTKST